MDNSTNNNSYGQNDYDQNQYSQNQYSQDQYSQNQYSQDQYSQNQYSQNQYSQNQYSQNSYNNQYYNPYSSGYNGQGYGKPPVDPGQGKGIASMVLGICSILFCGAYGLVGLTCGIIGLILTKQSTELSGGVPNGFAKAGKVCGIIGTILSGLMLLYVIFFVCIFAGTYSSFYSF